MSGGAAHTTPVHSEIRPYQPVFDHQGGSFVAPIHTVNQHPSVSAVTPKFNPDVAHAVKPMLQMLPFSANGSASYTKGPVHVGGDVHYSRLQNLPFSANGSASYTKGPVKVGGDVHYSRL